MSEKIEAYLSQLPLLDSNKIPDLIQSITELPDHPKIKSLEGGPYSSYFDLLNLFCYGSFEVYEENINKYPELRPTQIRKLKQLSIIDEAHNQKYIPYDLLFKKLKLSSSRELEDLVIELFYLEALSGKLDQQKALLEVDSAIGRDIREQQISELNTKINLWCSRVEGILDHMAKEIKLANDRRYESELHQNEVLEASRTIKEVLRGQIGKPETYLSRMDIDDVLLHPDLLTDNRNDSPRQETNSTENSTGDRIRIGVFKNLRHGKNTK